MNEVKVAVNGEKNEKFAWLPTVNTAQEHRVKGRLFEQGRLFEKLPCR